MSLDLMQKLPEQYQASPEVQALQHGLEPMAGALWASWEDFLLQIDPTTATWGLALWEKGYSLDTDITRDIDYRRRRVISKMRGQGTVDEAMIKNVAESFVSGEVEVLAFLDLFTFGVRFISTVGTPPNLEDLSAALDDIKPAHMAYRYLYRYLLIREIHEVMTLEELQRQTLDKFAFNGGE